MEIPVGVRVSFGVIDPLAMSFSPNDRLQSPKALDPLAHGSLRSPFAIRDLPLVGLALAVAEQDILTSFG